MIATAADPGDRRRTIVSLTERGDAEATPMLHADAVIARAYRVLLNEADAAVFEALWRLLAALRERGFLDRLVAAQAEDQEAGR